MSYICMIRSGIKDGTLQVLDLQPNTSNRKFTTQPVGQSKYLRYPDNETVATTGSGPITTSAAYKGVAAYLIDHVENTGGAGTALTAAEANSIAGEIISRMEAGSALALSDINTLINAEAGVSGSDLDGSLGDSTGTVAEVLKILAGGEYILPADSAIEDASNNFVATEAGSFTSGQYRATYNTGALRISWNEGFLSSFRSATFSYGGTSGAAVVVYDDDGSVYTG